MLRHSFRTPTNTFLRSFSTAPVGKIYPSADAAVADIKGDGSSLHIIFYCCEVFNIRTYYQTFFSAAACFTHLSIYLFICDQMATSFS
jgi:hypothetical protein